MRRRKNTALLTRLFPHSPFLRKVFIIALLCTLYIVGYNMYHLYLIKSQEAQLTQEKERLVEEQVELKEKTKSLNDPEVIEKKAREDLGLVKDGEVPYVK